MKITISVSPCHHHLHDHHHHHHDDYHHAGSSTKQGVEVWELMPELAKSITGGTLQKSIMGRTLAKSISGRNTGEKYHARGTLAKSITGRTLEKSIVQVHTSLDCSFNLSQFLFPTNSSEKEQSGI